MKKTPIILGVIAAIGAAIGTKLLVDAKRAEVRQRGLLEYLKQNSFSLQCVGGQWAVTDASGKVIGTPAETPEKAIHSAIWLRTILAEGQS